MAAFLDQFERIDPKAFAGFAGMGSVPRSAALAARHELTERSAAELARLAAAVDSIIANRARSLLATEAKRPRILAANADLIDAESVARLRSAYGDISLLQAALDTRGPGMRMRVAGIMVMKSEIFAVFALWRLIDAALLLRDPHSIYDRADYVPAPLTHAMPMRLRSIYDAGAALAEAAQAVCLVEQFKLAQRLLTNANEMVRTAVADAVAREATAASISRSASGRAAARARWSATESHRALVIEFASSRPFASRAEASRQAVLMLARRDDGDTYTLDTVDKWLKSANWRSNGKGKPKGNAV